MMTEDYYRIVLNSRGQPYLDAEAQLVALGQAAVSFLQGQLQSSTGLDHLITEVIVERIAGNQNFKASLDYFDRAEQRAAETILRLPPPEPVAEYLFQHFGDSVSSLLGVYLIKLGDIWPNWKTLAVIVYLGKLNSTASADALIQFLSTTTDALQRKIAIQALVSVGDESVIKKIEAELKPLDASDDALKLAAEQIREKVKPVS